MFLPPHMNTLILARTLLKPSSEAYYQTTAHQHTIKLNQELNQLNEEGLALYTKTEARVAAGELTGTFPAYYYLHVDSGMWIRDNDSVFASTGYFGNKTTNCTLTSKHDICIYGQLATSSEAMTATSVCIFVTTAWVLTANGSIYALGEYLGRLQ